MSDRATKFLERVDAYLDALPCGKPRRDFLSGQISAWEEHSRRFIRTEGRAYSKQDLLDSPQMADFTLTLAGLHYRLEEACRG